MKTVARDEILDYVTYEERREEVRETAMRAKAERRNHETMRYQVLEMVRTERMVKDADIRHEVDTYNELLGAPGELGATLLIELEDAALRAEKLAQWLALPQPSGMRLAFASSHCANVCSCGLSEREKARSRWAQYSFSKSHLYWNMLPRSSAPGKPNFR